MPHRHQFVVAGLTICLAASVAVAPASAAVTIMYKFAGGASDGAAPSALAIQGTTLYGATYSGGDVDRGTLFKINTDSSGFQLLREFAGGANDGEAPSGGLTLAGSTMYGTTSVGGDTDNGTVFKINTDGTGHQLLHEFAGGTIDGTEPPSTLTLQGSTLFGITAPGETGNKGTVFRVNSDGTGFQLLHTFVGGANDGRSPFGALTLNGTTIYGTTLSGGDSNRGTLFRINSDGTGFQLLHEFTGGANGGEFPGGGLTLVGSLLYGTTVFGGDSDRGTLFKINTDGTAFQLLHEFVGGSNDGSFVNGALTLVGTSLYGTSAYGGDADVGTVFKINTDGSGFQLLHEFAGGLDDGATPFEGLTFAGSTLYGTTSEGGGSGSGFGTIFALNVPAAGSPGDYSGNGSVGPEDYVLWKSTFGSTSQLAADGNGNNVVDAADYTIWRNHFGSDGASANNAVAVPEPTAAPLIAIVGLVAGQIRARRRWSPQRLLAIA